MNGAYGMVIDVGIQSILLLSTPFPNSLKTAKKTVKDVISTAWDDHFCWVKHAIA